ncbi:hypothetical protein P692DRAFT_201801386 [Suillus brevipes Sb2]|nr:hypothetical protein P692DRAFT_201801386 [Suillus brevipes Sb2]
MSFSLGAPQIDNVLYRLCGSVLSSNSETFNSMFAATESAGLEEIDGKSDERPIHLAGTTREMFELFLEHTFGRAAVSDQHVGDFSNPSGSSTVPRLAMSSLSRS